MIYGQGRRQGRRRSDRADWESGRRAGERRQEHDAAGIDGPQKKKGLALGGEVWLKWTRE
jgi:hypothetical protein